MALVVDVGIGVVGKQPVGGRDRKGRLLGRGIAVRSGDRIVIGAIDRHHDVLCRDASIVVIDDNRRGDRQRFAAGKEVEIAIDDIVVPVDVAGVGIAGLGADRDGRLQRRDLGRCQFRGEVMRGILPGDGFARGIDRSRRTVVKVGIDEGNDAGGRIHR